MQEDRTDRRTYDAPQLGLLRFESIRVDALDYEMARFRGAVVPHVDTETKAAIEAVP